MDTDQTQVTYWDKRLEQGWACTHQIVPREMLAYDADPLDAAAVLPSSDHELKACELESSDSTRHLLQIRISVI